jgi:glutathione peroxidase
MKKYFLILFLVIFAYACDQVKSKPEADEQNETEVTAMTTFHDFKMTSIEGEEIDFSKYKGKKVLLVNVASKCGYTPQYEDLQALHEKYGDKVEVLGFPANNFGGQEPGTNEEIADFCKKNFGVDFQMFEKISVKGEDKHPLYQWLSSKDQNGWNDQEPTWNFCKYLINENGELVKFFASGVNPFDDALLQEIQ